MENFEGSYAQAKMLPERLVNESNAKYLLRLEGMSRYLFHGSSDRYDELIPSESKTDTGDDDWNKAKGVFASPNAIGVAGMAILGRRDKRRGNWRVDITFDLDSPSRNVVKITPNIELKEGYIYVLSRNGFSPNEKGSQYKSEQVVKPLEVIEVSPEDFKEMGGQVVVEEAEEWSEYASNR